MSHDRDTFLPARELMVRAIDYATKIEHRLGRLSGLSRDSRAALLQSAFRSEQARLTTSLRRYLQDAPAGILETFAQATIAVPESLPELGAPMTPESLTQWMLDVNRPLLALFSEAGDALEATAAHDVFDNLASLVQHHEMSIVRAADGASDL